MTDRCIPMMGYEYLKLNYILLTLGLTSCIACLAIILGFIRMVHIPHIFDPTIIILFLAICDFMLAMNSILDGLSIQCSSNQLCWTKAILNQFFGISSFLWTAAISHSSYTAVSGLYTRQTLDSSTLMKRYHICCWGLPFIIVIIMFGTSTSAESTGYSCISGIESTRDRFIKKDAFIFINLLLYFLPLVIVQIFNVYVFRFLSKTLRYMPTVNDVQRKFTRYLLVVIITKAVFIISRYKIIVDPENQSLPFTVVMLLGPPLQV